MLNQLHFGTFPAKTEYNNMHNEQLCCKTGVLDFVKAVALAIVIMCCISIKHPIDKLKYYNTTGKHNWLRKRFTKKHSDLLRVVQE